MYFLSGSHRYRISANKKLLVGWWHSVLNDGTPPPFPLRYLGVLDACSGGQSIGILFAWEGYIFPCLFYQGHHVA